MPFPPSSGTIISLELVGGHCVQSSAIHIDHTYSGLLEGVPIPSMNAEHLSAIPHRLKRIFGELPVFIIPPIFEEQKLLRSFMGHTSSQMMPRFEVAALFSMGLPRKNGHQLRRL